MKERENTHHDTLAIILISNVRVTFFICCPSNSQNNPASARTPLYYDAKSLVLVDHFTKMKIEMSCDELTRRE